MPMTYQFNVPFRIPTDGPTNGQKDEIRNALRFFFSNHHYGYIYANYSIRDIVNGMTLW